MSIVHLLPFQTKLFERPIADIQALLHLAPVHLVHSGALRRNDHGPPSSAEPVRNAARVYGQATHVPHVAARRRPISNTQLRNIHVFPDLLLFHIHSNFLW